MAKIYQVSFYAVDPNDFCLDMDYAVYELAQSTGTIIHQQHIRESKPFEWVDEDPTNFKNCDLKALEARFDHTNDASVHTGDEVVIGGLYRHFKGEIVEVIAVARDTEYGGLSVIYEYKPTHTIWSRPLDMFLSEVDHEKYPDVKQKMRFERIGCAEQHRDRGFSLDHIG